MCSYPHSNTALVTNVKLTFPKKPATLLDKKIVLTTVFHIIEFAIVVRTRRLRLTPKDMNAERTIPTLLNQIREEVLPYIAHPSELQTTASLQDLRSRLHSLHYYCIRSQIPGPVCNRVEILLSTSSDLWHLIAENELMLKNLKEYTRVRTFSAEAEGITNIGELISGEDTLRDVLINSVAFMLNWKANTIWVDSAKRARTAMAKNYMLEIQDRVWQFIKESTVETEDDDLEKAEQVRERADRLLAVVYASDLPTEAQVTLLMQIYTLLLRLQLAFAADMPTVSPGTEVRITAPKTGKTFLLYVPIDYTDKRPFPVIFCYHGYRGTATTWPFKQVTKGQGFIVVGMNYATDLYYTKLLPTETAKEKIFFDEALELTSARVNVASEYIFMGGYSQGGYSTTAFGEQLLDRLAGSLVLGAGRRDVDMNPPPAELIRGHPFFYGVGELDDPHYPRAKHALQFYTECGADVTFEGWENETHSLSPKWLTKTKMREWLINYGPMKQVESGFEKAQTAEKNGKLGEAFTLYTQIAEILPDTELCRTAKESATRLRTQAETQFDQLKKTADEKPYTETVKALEVFRDKYVGSVFAERASQLRSELLNARADALEGRAREAEAQKNYARALQLYKLYLTYFPEAKRYAEVQKHVKILKNKTGMK